jgi:hypothetical protein
MKVKSKHKFEDHESKNVKIVIKNVINTEKVLNGL